MKKEKNYSEILRNLKYSNILDMERVNAIQEKVSTTYAESVPRSETDKKNLELTESLSKIARRGSYLSGFLIANSSAIEIFGRGIRLTSYKADFLENVAGLIIQGLSYGADIAMRAINPIDMPFQSAAIASVACATMIATKIGSEKIGKSYKNKISDDIEIKAKASLDICLKDVNLQKNEEVKDKLVDFLKSNNLVVDKDKNIQRAKP